MKIYGVFIAISYRFVPEDRRKKATYPFNTLQTWGDIDYAKTVLFDIMDFDEIIEMTDKPHNFNTDLFPTKKNIVNHLMKLQKRLQSGDFVVFHFSGHGVQVKGDKWTKVIPKKDRYELDDIDEALVTYDIAYDWTAESLILDDWIYEWIAGFPRNVHGLFVVDACRSGGIFDARVTLGDEEILNSESCSTDDISYMPFFHVNHNRQFVGAHILGLSAGTSNQVVADRGSGAHLVKRGVGAFTEHVYSTISQNKDINVAEFIWTARQRVRKSALHMKFQIPDGQKPCASFLSEKQSVTDQLIPVMFQKPRHRPPSKVPFVVIQKPTPPSPPPTTTTTTTTMIQSTVRHSEQTPEKNV